MGPSFCHITVWVVYRHSCVRTKILMVTMKMYTSWFCSQVLHRDKHDKNKGCPLLGRILFLLSAGLFTSSPLEQPIFVIHTKNVCV